MSLDRIENKLDDVVKYQNKSLIDIEVVKTDISFIKGHMQNAHHMYNEIRARQDECPARLKELAGKNERPKIALWANLAVVLIALGSLIVAVAALYAKG